MNVEELNETTEEAHHAGAKSIGLTTAIVAVLLAVATLLGHRAHTEEVIIQGNRNTQWTNYDTKTVRALQYQTASRLAALMPNGQEVAAEYTEKAQVEREGEAAKDGKPVKLGADKTREKAQELDAELKLMQRRSARYDAAELFLEISIVLCSIALLAEDKIYWKFSFVTTAIGVALAAWGWVLQ
jgi:LPS O-antigen subunit length determinant protein (WzzB/FepE family)